MGAGAAVFHPFSYRAGMVGGALLSLLLGAISLILSAVYKDPVDDSDVPAPSYTPELEQDFADIAEPCRSRAEAGDAEAQYVYGLTLYYGLGRPKDETEAAKWFEKAAEQGNKDAKNTLRELSVRGDRSGAQWKSALVAGGAFAAIGAMALGGEHARPLVFLAGFGAYAATLVLGLPRRLAETVSAIWALLFKRGRKAVPDGGGAAAGEE